MIRMLEDVKKRLGSLGISVSGEPSNSDDLILSFTIDKVANHINNQTNLMSIPKGLEEIAIDMVVGEFLFLKKAWGSWMLKRSTFPLLLSGCGMVIQMWNLPSEKRVPRKRISARC